MSAAKKFQPLHLLLLWAVWSTHSQAALFCPPLLAGQGSEGLLTDLGNAYREILATVSLSTEQLKALREGENPLALDPGVDSPLSVVRDALKAIEDFAQAQAIASGALWKRLRGILDEELENRAQQNNSAALADTWDRAHVSLRRIPEREFLRADLGTAAFAPDSQAFYVARMRSNQFLRFDLATGAVLEGQHRVGSDVGSSSLAVSANGLRLLAGGGDRQPILVFDARTLGEIGPFQTSGNVARFALSADATRMALQLSALSIWKFDEKGTTESVPFPTHVGPVRGFVLNDSYLAAHSPGSSALNFHPVDPRAPAYQIDLFMQGYEQMTGQELHPTLPEVAAADAQKPQVAVWNWQTNQKVRELEYPGLGTRGYSSTAYSADGKYIAASGYPLATIFVWHSQSGELVGSWQTGAGSPSRLFFSPDGRKLISYSVPRVQVWDIEGLQGVRP